MAARNRADKKICPVGHEEYRLEPGRSVATFLGYPVGFVQVIAARLIQSGIWAGDEVSSEPWLDPVKAPVSFMLDLMVAEGKFTASWSEEKGQRSYYLPE